MCALIQEENRMEDKIQLRATRSPGIYFIKILKKLKRMNMVRKREE